VPLYFRRYLKRLSNHKNTKAVSKVPLASGTEMQIHISEAHKDYQLWYLSIKIGLQTEQYSRYQPCGHSLDLYVTMC
jgi:hypothetical protein